MTLFEDPDLLDSYAEPAHALAFARIENHYFVNHGWLSEGQLIANAGQLADIPGITVQGRYDMCTPPVTVWDLHRVWPKSRLLMVPATGHSATEPGNTRCLILVTDEFADR